MLDLSFKVDTFLHIDREARLLGLHNPGGGPDGVGGSNLAGGKHPSKEKIVVDMARMAQMFGRRPGPSHELANGPMPVVLVTSIRGSRYNGIGSDSVP